MTSPTTEGRWDEALPLDFARIQKLRSLRLIEPDLEYLCKVRKGSRSSGNSRVYSLSTSPRCGLSTLHYVTSYVCGVGSSAVIAFPFGLFTDRYWSSFARAKCGRNPHILVNHAAWTSRKFHERQNLLLHRTETRLYSYSGEPAVFCQRTEKCFLETLQFVCVFFSGCYKLQQCNMCSSIFF